MRERHRQVRLLGLRRQVAVDAVRGVALHPRKRREITQAGRAMEARVAFVAAAPVEPDAARAGRVALPAAGTTTIASIARIPQLSTFL
ncbi:hypothetical protein, partial [Burkholderia pyrrocinia]|uniref:hypothetical protein n=1 Tax=Burkholderia pyrrocinia TaxID=60550 RepID=UPI0020C5BB9E